MSVDQFKINLNQNLWGLLISLIALGTGEYYCLRTLYWVGLVLAGFTGVSYIITLFPYTRTYWKNKNEK